jgi:molybdopterin-guanine dinucleotide biosynthesis protein A
MSPPPFSALLLAGGRSTRMGRDKALLPHPVSGLPQLARQAALLRSLPGCAELLLSAPADRGYALAGPLADARLVPDAAPGLGPLAGLAAGLEAATTSRLLVLAVDLPFVTASFLGSLLWRDAALPENPPPIPPSAGLAPRHADGLFEPLCALYPVFTDSRSAVAAALVHRELSLQRLLAAACAAGWMLPRPLAPGEAALLANWNTAADRSAPPPPGEPLTTPAPREA